MCSRISIKKIDFHWCDDPALSGLPLVRNGAEPASLTSWVYGAQDFSAGVFLCGREGIRVKVCFDTEESLGEGSHIYGEIDGVKRFSQLSGSRDFLFIPGLRCAGFEDVVVRWFAAGMEGAAELITTTRHRFYYLLDLPGNPWHREGGEVLWSDVLDWFFSRVAFVQDKRTAASLLTKVLYGFLEQGMLRYNRANMQAGFVCKGSNSFLCQKFLKVLKNPPRAGEVPVNCEDLASLLAVTCNSVGGDFRVLRIRRPRDAVSLFKPQKRVLFSPGAYRPFLYHEVATEGDPVEMKIPGDTLIWDSCLRLREEYGDVDVTGLPFLEGEPHYAELFTPVALESYKCSLVRHHII